MVIGDIKLFEIRDVNREKLIKLLCLVTLLSSPIIISIVALGNVTPRPCSVYSLRNESPIYRRSGNITVDVL